MGGSPFVTASPPHDVEMEQSILGACLVRSERLDDVLPVLESGDFYQQNHRVIYDAMVHLVSNGIGVDLVTMAEHLHSKGLYSSVGGGSYLAALADRFVTAVHVDEWARALRDLSRRRKVMQLSVEMFEAAADRTVAVGDVASGASDLVDGILADKIDTGRQTPVQVVRDFQEWLDFAVDENAGVPLPFPKAQKMTGGFLPGEMIVLAARPSNGKTALMLNSCLYAMGQGCKVGIVSLEMRSRSLMSRICAMALDINAQRFRDRGISLEERRRIDDFCGRFQSKPFRMWDEPEFSPGRMRSVVKSWKRQMGGLDFLVVDYLQLLGSDQVDGRMTMNREQEVARISKAIKRLALGEEVPVMILAQLNREAEKSSKPMLSHLRESGSLEQDADFVLFLSFWDPRQAGNEVAVDLDVAKGRSSQTGTIPLTYVRPFLRFEPRLEV